MCLKWYVYACAFVSVCVSLYGCVCKGMYLCEFIWMCVCVRACV